jgi:hypothetical protein
LRHHVRHPEAATDLDQLASGDQHFASAGERCQHQHRRGRVVVDDNGGVGAGQARDQVRGVRVAAPACAAREVVFEVGVAGRDFGDAIRRRPRQRRAPEIRVNDHARGVDHAGQRGTHRRAQPRVGAALDRVDCLGHRDRRDRARAEVVAQRRGLGPQGVNERCPPVARLERAHGLALT